MAPRDGVVPAAEIGASNRSARFAQAINKTKPAIANNNQSDCSYFSRN